MKIIDTISKIDEVSAFNFEQTLFRLADLHVEGYNGGMWENERLNENLYFMGLPVSYGVVHVSIPANFSDVHCDSRSAGAALTLMALNNVLFDLYHKGKNTDEMAELFDDLRNAILDDKTLDIRAILKIID